MATVRIVRLYCHSKYNKYPYNLLRGLEVEVCIKVLEN